MLNYVAPDLPDSALLTSSPGSSMPDSMLDSGCLVVLLSGHIDPSSMLGNFHGCEMVSVLTIS